MSLVLFLSIYYHVRFDKSQLFNHSLTQSVVKEGRLNTSIPMWRSYFNIIIIVKCQAADSQPSKIMET